VKNFLFVLLALSAFSASAQTSAPITDYFDKDWKRVTDSTQAAFYRTIEQNDHGYVVRDYYISGKIQMFAECSEVSPEPNKEGNTILYFENGNIDHEGQYHDNKEVGVHKWYFENGKPRKEIEYQDEKTLYHHWWREDGHDELEDGEAVVLERSVKRFDYYSEIKNFEIVDAYSVERTSGDTVYVVVESKPEYFGGTGQMNMDIIKNLKYPASARRQRVSGTVFVAFIVGKDGIARDFDVIRGVSQDCDQAALNAVASLKRWKPGMYTKKIPGATPHPVAVRYVLPIVFKLH